MKVFKAIEFIKELFGQDEKIYVVLRKNLSNLPIEEQEGDEVLEKIKEPSEVVWANDEEDKHG